LADTFALGDADAAKLLAMARNPETPPPLGVPDVLKDAKADPFFRANFGLAIARHLSNRRVHEEALLILKGITPEQTIDPAAYLSHRAMSEHGLVRKDDAGSTIVPRIQDAVDSPERYNTAGTPI